MCSMNETIQCARGNGASQCALGMGQANVPWEWDYPMFPGNGTCQCALGMRLYNVPWEWD